VLSVLDDLERLFLAAWAFKGAPIMVRLVGLDRRKPHLRATRPTVGKIHHLLSKSLLIREHATHPSMFRLFYIPSKPRALKKYTSAYIGTGTAEDGDSGGPSGRFPWWGCLVIGTLSVVL
jgi:hypothetical protein